MIKREDFLEHGFKPAYNPYKTSFWIRLSKNEIPQNLRESTDEYQILGWESGYVDGKETWKIDIVEKNVKGERIIYEKDGLWICTEWADGDDSQRHAYMTNWNEHCPLNMDFDGLIASLLCYIQNKKKKSISEYRKKIAKLKKEHEREIKDLNKKIVTLKEAVK